MDHTPYNSLKNALVATGAWFINLAGMMSNVRRKKKDPDCRPGPLMFCQIITPANVIARCIVGAYITQLNHEHCRRRARPVALTASAIRLYPIRVWCRTLNERESASSQFGKCY